jgi:hypothetical protein
MQQVTTCGWWLMVVAVCVFAVESISVTRQLAMQIEVCTHSPSAVPTFAKRDERKSQGAISHRQV